jgi:hypothetical protein
MKATPEASRADQHGRPLVDIGWILVQPLDPPDREAASQAARRCQQLLEAQFPELAFQLTSVGPRDFGIGREVDIVSTLEQGALEREVRRWDFVFVVTGADLETQYIPWGFGASARSLAAAIISSFRIDPDFSEAETSPEARSDRIAHRMVLLFLKAFGLLNGLSSSDRYETVMGPTTAVTDLDREPEWDAGQLQRLRTALSAVADPRVEEQVEPGFSTMRFYLRTIRAHPGAILGSIRQAEPWLFPLRLSRLTAAALSALLLLMITAEVWELGLTQPGVTVVAASGAAWLGTTIYVLSRQRLGARHSGTRLLEHTVQSQVSMVVVIALGMAVTYALLFITSLGLGVILFSSELLSGWAPSLDHSLHWSDRFAFSGTVAALGLVVGALGASFEKEDYFRHVAEVDVEF